MGAPLYEIDTDAEASVTSAPKAEAPADTASDTPAAEEAPAVVAAASAPPATATKAQQQHRTPSIQFLGKEGWAARLRAAPVVELPPMHPMFGRPPFTEEEMEALVLGGAEQAPKLVTPSSQAVFL